MDLQKILAEKESDTVEFKKSTSLLRPTFETICAFLNGHGGIVLIGINDKCQIVGQDISDSTRQEIARELQKIEPAAHVEIEYIPVEGSKQIITIKVEAGKHIPYIYDGRPYQRNQSTTSRMSQHRYEQLLIQRGQLNHSWEELFASDYDIDDLDHEEILRTIQEGVHVNRIPPEALNDNIEDALIRLKLLENDRLKNAAIILFAKDVFPSYGQCMLKMGRFAGISYTSDFIDNQHIYGNIFILLSEANNFIKRHLPIASIFHHEALERIDTPALPVLALREALVNAVCHRDYSLQSGSSTLAIFDDRLEIWNTGVLPPQLNVNDLKKRHESYPRNKLIASVLYIRKFFEKWGSGTNKMFNLCHEQSLPEPEFAEYSGGFSVSFKFKTPLNIKIPVPSKTQQLNQRQEEILTIITTQQPVTIQQIMTQLNNPPSQRMIQKDLKDLREKGLIESQGAGKKTTWILLN